MGKLDEGGEFLERLVILLLSGPIIVVFSYVIWILLIINFFAVLFSGKRNADVANFWKTFNKEFYRFLRYMTFESNKKPFPFSNSRT
ncbi:DUF4389 domain-containing protein [Candidatus Pacearchaeota archaeon]|nr:MAG: DUF4389 domain-containing protein [Candidatus Pacearchaeota archaeon]